MAKWPNDAIEGVKVHKVIPRPTALRAVGKKGMVCQFLNGMVCPPATSEAGARPLEGLRALQINS
jgi:hypothetical protein